MGSAEEKEKLVLEKGALHSKPPVHVPIDLQWPSRAGVWLSPTGAGNSTGSQPTSARTVRNPPQLGPNRHEKLHSNTLQRKTEVEGHLDSAWLA